MNKQIFFIVIFAITGHIQPGPPGIVSWIHYNNLMKEEENKIENFKAEIKSLINSSKSKSEIANLANMIKSSKKQIKKLETIKDDCLM